MNVQKTALASLSSHSAGLGLRRGIIDETKQLTSRDVDFLEVAPENWIGIGGRYGKDFHALAERFPITLHGLSLNIGGYTPLDVDLLRNIRQFIDTYQCPIYSEHLSYCGDHGHLYDLMPIPFCEEAVRHVSERVRQVQDILGCRIALENVSYYANPLMSLSEAEFINAVLSESDCDLLLDINNIYVNSINQQYDPYEFLAAMPSSRVKYMHIAGHYIEQEDLRVDTHGAEVEEAVWRLLDAAYAQIGVVPTLLERDFNFPPMSELLAEVSRIRHCQATVQSAQLATGAP